MWLIHQKTRFKFFSNPYKQMQLQSTSQLGQITEKQLKKNLKNEYEIRDKSKLVLISRNPPFTEFYIFLLQGVSNKNENMGLQSRL